MPNNYSKQELRNSALEEIKVKDSANDADPSDTTVADDEIQRHIEYLEDEGLIVFDASVAITTENIPGRMFNALRDMCAEILAPRFGVEPRIVTGPHRQPEAMYDNALRRLRRSALDSDNDVPVRAEYF